MDSNSCPPVNNALLPDIYNKLDADLQERTRVINTQLDKRLVLQEKVLSRYRLAAEKLHREESHRVRRDLVKISHKLPDVGNIRNFCLGYYTRQKPIPKKIKGVPSEKTYMPFCERHYIHHLSTKKKYYKQDSPTPPMPVIAEQSVHSLGSPNALELNGTVTVGDETVSAVMDVERTDVSTSDASELHVKPVDPSLMLPTSR